jgi:hypothetical protein
MSSNEKFLFEIADMNGSSLKLDQIKIRKYAPISPSTAP